nr:DUF445 family protein [Clostridia bacterium]
MNFLHYILGPLIGALIGYLTNFIAVKMLFRPYTPKKLFGKTLPFTPGIIPKRKDALAKAIGNAVGHRLFTGDDLKDLLLAEKTKDKVIKVAMEALDLNLVFDGKSDNMQTANSLALTYLTEEQWGKTKGKITRTISERMLAAAKDMDLGKVVAEQGTAAILEKKSSLGMLSLVVNEHMLNAIMPTFAEKINEYIEENGKSMINRAVIKQLDDYTNRPLHDVMDYTDKEQIEHIITVAYEKLISAIGRKFNDYLDIASVVESKVSAMSPKELEDLTMMVMKKELSAVVNLGGIIGLILGILNLFV